MLRISDYLRLLSGIALTLFSATFFTLLFAGGAAIPVERHGVMWAVKAQTGSIVVTNAPQVARDQQRRQLLKGRCLQLRMQAFAYATPLEKEQPKELEEWARELRAQQDANQALKKEIANLGFRGIYLRVHPPSYQPEELRDAYEVDDIIGFSNPGVVTTLNERRFLCWPIPLLVGAGGIYILVPPIRRIRRYCLGLCLECGYDTSFSGCRCPECGTIVHRKK